MARQATLAWRMFKVTASVLFAIGALVVIGQGFLFYRIFADMHPALGIAFIFMLTGLLFLLVWRPLLSFFQTPVMATPPDIPVAVDALMPDMLHARLRYDLAYLKALGRHPGLVDQRGEILRAEQAGRVLLARIRAEPDIKIAAAAVSQFEQDEIEARLVALDAKVDALIKSEAVNVGVATAFSMNGTVDAFIVLWRNANLISQISRVYFGRPHLRGSLMIMRDVAAMVVVSRALEDVTDITGEVIGGLLGRMGGLLAGPVMDGAVNALMTLKLGYLAKRRCRSFQGWSVEAAAPISRDALARVKRDSTAVIGELLKRCGSLTASAARATEHVMNGSKSAWTLVQSWFGGLSTKA